MRLGTLNIGALSGKEDIIRGLECDVCALQETVVPRHKRASISTYIRQLGGSIVYSDINPADECLRGQNKGVRLGSGLACVAFCALESLPSPVPPPGHTRLAQVQIQGSAMSGSQMGLCR